MNSSKYDIYAIVGHRPIACDPMTKENIGARSKLKTCGKLRRLVPRRLPDVQADEEDDQQPDDREQQQRRPHLAALDARRLSGARLVHASRSAGELCCTGKHSLPPCSAS